MSICLFILFLFVLYGSGMGGIFARRRHKNIKQSCHRGVSANFLMCGVYFYFMFSWIAVFISILLFVPGISIRHLLCKPFIELDNNQIFKVYLFFIILLKFNDYYNSKNRIYIMLLLIHMKLK